MGEKFLMKGNEAIAEAAIRAGCKCFFGYPITPQTELIAYMAKNMGKVNGVFLQAESEIAAINMVYGCGGTGVRCMTSSSSPGISLMSEGISYLAAAEIPCVLVDIVRCGPGLGGIQPAQSDYLFVNKGLGHGDFNILVYAPSSIQEMTELIHDAFDLSDLYRIPVMIMADGMIGQMMEAVEFKNKEKRELPEKTWAANGLGNRRKHNIINSLELNPEKLEELNLKLQDKYKVIKEKESKYELYNCENSCDLILVSYGITARICKSVINLAKNDGINLGLIRPITTWPFPYEAFTKTLGKSKFGYLSVEMNCGQMVEDVKLAVNGSEEVRFYGRTGGMIPKVDEIYENIKSIIGGIENEYSL